METILELGGCLFCFNHIWGHYYRMYLLKLFFWCGNMTLVNIYHMCMYFVCFSRVAYLLSKNFSKVDIAQMVRNAPFLLSFSVERLDNRLGFFQKELELSVKKVKRRGEFVCFHVSYI